jgi:ZIP family zinc transporter
MWNILIGILIPLVGTILGSSIVLFAKDKLNSKVEKLLLGFASGVMIAASIWSLIIPSIEMSENMGKFSIIPASVGFILGMLFLLGLDSFLPHLHIHSEEVEGVKKSNIKKKTMMFLAVTLHNIPEGMAIGVVFAGFLMGNVGISLTGAIALSIGIAIQNIPEGAIVSFDMKNKGENNKKSFLYGVVSGVVEPIGSLVVILFSALLTSIIPYFLSFAAGAMIYVVVEELIPESQTGKHSNIATIGVMIGFTLMMILDVVLA